MRSSPALGLTSLSLFLVVALAFGSGCGADKNHAERDAYAESLAAAASAEAEASGTPAPVYSDACLSGKCLPDPGSRAVSAEECEAAEAPFEFFPIPLWDFETGLAALSYTYDDDTTDSMNIAGWEPPTIEDPFGRCGREGNEVLHITGGPFLEWGGGFGRSLRCMNGNLNTLKQAGTPLEEVWCPTTIVPGTGTLSPACELAQRAELNEEQAKIAAACPERDRADQAGEELPVEEQAALGQTVDLSDWEGIAFWARRGPNSQTGFRVAVGDRNTDDDISFVQYVLDPMSPRRCERSVPCTCQDRNRPCTTLTEEDIEALYGDPDPSRPYWNGKPATCQPGQTQTARCLRAGDSICYNRETDPPLGEERDYIICGDTACGWPSASAKSLNGVLTHQPTERYETTSAVPTDTGWGTHYGDVQFQDTTCRPWSFHGSVTGGYCYDPESAIPGRQEPFESTEICGDHWLRPVALSLDWELYLVPFTDLLQQGWAKRFYELDLTSLALARLTWDRGFVDFYVDDVRFYRKKR